MSIAVLDAFDRTRFLLHATEMAVSGLEDREQMNALVALLAAIEAQLSTAIDLSDKTSATGQE